LREIRPGNDGDSNYSPQHEEFLLRAVPGTLREGAMALGRQQVEDNRHGVLPAASGGILNRYVAGVGARSRRDGSTAFHRFQQSLLEPPGGLSRSRRFR